MSSDGSQLAAQMAKEGNFGADVYMALSTVTPGAGGVLVPTNMAADVIEALRPVAVLRRMGVTSLPLVNTYTRSRARAAVSRLRRLL